MKKIINPAETRKKRCPKTAIGASASTIMVILSKFTIGSKSKAVAAHAPKFGVLVAGLFCCGDKLTPCVHATVRLAISGVLMVFGDWHSGADSFTNVQWRAVTPEGFYRRPLRQNWN